MVAYITSLGDIYAATGQGRRQVDEPTAFKTPPRAADLGAGERVFGERCAICHGSDGLGLHATPNRADGYVFPPLWGRQFQRRRRHAPRAHRRTIYQGQDAAWEARPDRR
jgi:cytochrome c